LGERLLCKQEVIGSIPFTSTIGPSTIGKLAMGPSGPACRRWWRATFGEDQEITVPGQSGAGAV
jgi:hypothetical protein